MKKLIIGAVLLLAPIATSCDKDNDNAGSSEYTPIELPGNTRAGVQKNNELAFELIGSTPAFTNTNEENSVVSPFSFFSIVTMLASADPATIVPALNISCSAEEIEAMRQYVTILNEKLPKVDSSTQFLSANAAFTTDQFPLAPGFVSTSKSMMPFEAYVGNVDNIGPQIEKWLKEQSKGLFQTGILNPSTPCFINSLYFKGNWSSPFEPANTNRASFKSASGSISEVEFMKQSTDLKYAESDGWQSVELPYGNENFSMVAILPPSETKENTLTSNLWTSLENNCSTYFVKLDFPKFSVSSCLDLSKYLKEKCGVAEGLEVSGVQKEGSLKIEEIWQNFMITVNEESTEMSTFTIVTTPLAPGPCGVVELKFNRPFYFVIKENSTGTILSIGRINTL